jgi:hypothetical protein
MKILKKLEKLHDIVKHDNEHGNPKGALGKKLSDAAVAAITNGIKSPEWVQYMSLFADNDAQLKRLTVPNPQNDPSYLPLMRAYIVSNAVCDVGTNNHTAKNIDERVDAGLSDASDGTVVAKRPFVIVGLE